MIHIQKVFRHGRKQGAARNDFCAKLLAAVYYPTGRFFLDGHCREEHIVRPANVAIPQFRRRHISIAATVSNPKGGRIALLEMNFKAFLKLQKVTGTSGLTSNTLIMAIELCY
jgi:hypothetical protein